LPIFVSKYLANKYGKLLNTKCIIANESRILPQMIVKEDKFLPDIKNLVQRILYVGRLSPEKGLNELFIALKLLSKRISFEALIIGDGIDEKKYRDLVLKLKLCSCIQFLGPISWGDELFSIMRKCDVLVLPSKTEGLPLVLIEAMSQGVPVVATNVGGIPEIVEDRISGLLVTPGSAKDLANALFDMLFDKNLRYQLIENGQRIAQKNTFTEQTGKISKLVLKLIYEKNLFHKN
jgi:glycosyltransferase involved in cell wall biosynthesis